MNARAAGGSAAAPACDRPVGAACRAGAAAGAGRGCGAEDASGGARSGVRAAALQPGPAGREQRTERGSPLEFVEHTRGTGLLPVSVTAPAAGAGPASAACPAACERARVAPSGLLRGTRHPGGGGCASQPLTASELRSHRFPISFTPPEPGGAWRSRRCLLLLTPGGGGEGPPSSCRGAQGLRCAPSCKRDSAGKL